MLSIVTALKKRRRGVEGIRSAEFGTDEGTIPGIEQKENQGKWT
jgi:hypothetical protein